MCIYIPSISSHFNVTSNETALRIFSFDCLFPMTFPSSQQWTQSVWWKKERMNIQLRSLPNFSTLYHTVFFFFFFFFPPTSLALFCNWLLSCLPSQVLVFRSTQSLSNSSASPSSAQSAFNPMFADSLVPIKLGALKLLSKLKAVRIY